MSRTLTLTKTHSAQSRPPLRPVRLGPADVLVERKTDGTILMRSPYPLQPYPKKLTERLAYWAGVAPERVFLAQRDASGEWRRLTYAAAFASVRAIASEASANMTMTVSFEFGIGPA